MPTAAAAQVLLELTTRSKPSVSPIDINTDLPPAIYAGEDVDFSVAIFDPFGNSVDLSNLQFLEMDIFPAQQAPLASPGNLGYAPYASVPYPTVPPAPLMFATVPAFSITPTVAKAVWYEGYASQATFSFSFVQTGLLNLGGLNEADFWIVVHGLTNIGRSITYGAGKLKVYQSGQSGQAPIYLPNTVAPLQVPAATVLYVAPNSQIPFAATINVNGGTIIVAGELVQTPVGIATLPVVIVGVSSTLVANAYTVVTAAGATSQALPNSLSAGTVCVVKVQGTGVVTVTGAIFSFGAVSSYVVGGEGSAVIFTFDGTYWNVS